MPSSDITSNSISSNRPYLLRAIYEWLSDNNLTPQILVDASAPGVKVPQQHVKDGQILLNVSMSAIKNLQMENEQVSFNARFSGAAMQILIPIGAVLAIFAQENGQGMAFPDQQQLVDAQVSEQTSEKPSEKILEGVDIDEGSSDDLPPNKKIKPTLKIVK